MDDAVGDEDRRADPVGGNIAKRRLQGREEAGCLDCQNRILPVSMNRGLDIVEGGEALFQLGANMRCLAAARLPDSVWLPD